MELILEQVAAQTLPAAIDSVCCGHEFARRCMCNILLMRPKVRGTQMANRSWPNSEMAENCRHCADIWHAPGTCHFNNSRLLDCLCVCLWHGRSTSRPTCFWVLVRCSIG